MINKDVKEHLRNSQDKYQFYGEKDLLMTYPTSTPTIKVKLLKIFAVKRYTYFQNMKASIL